MDPRVPISTDNIYKFQATFGLVIIITAFVLFVLNNQHANQSIISNLEKLLVIDESAKQAEEHEKLYKRQIDVAVSNRTHYTYAIGVILAIGILVSWLGFTRWSNQIQPIHDDILRLEKEKLELEVAVLRDQAGSNSQIQARTTPRPEGDQVTGVHTA